MDNTMNSASNKCITCQTYEVNPMITDSDSVPGKSFCSRTCQGIWIDSARWLDSEALKRIALMQHEMLKEMEN